MMFDKKDVDAAGHPIVRLLRLIFYRQKVTLDQFSSMYAKHGKRIGLSPDEINTNKNNARKALAPSKDDMTWRFFHYMLSSILLLDIEEVILVIKLDSGELIEIGSRDKADQPPRIVSRNNQSGQKNNETTL